MIYFDSETCGLHGPIVLLQYAEDDGPVVLHNVWKEPIIDTMNLIERMVNHKDGLVAFNIAFDWFHICQLYTTLSLLPDYTATPEEFINHYAQAEPQARDGMCLRPYRACDLMLHARRGPYQSTMDRKSIRIRRVPTALAELLADELERRIPLKDIYFSRRKDKHARKWRVDDIEGRPEFKNLVLKFSASSALKAICSDAFDRPADARLLFSDIELPRKFWPAEKGYAPFALSVGKPGKWNRAWPEVISHHINHWAYNSLAREYAEADVTDTRLLWKHFGSPEPGDTDSELACMVAACRWRGYYVDVAGLRKAKKEALELMQKAPRAPKNVRAYISEVLSHEERLAMAAGTAQKSITELKISTKKTVLEDLAKCFIECEKCEGKGIIKPRRKYTLSATMPSIDGENGSIEWPECPACHGQKYFKHPVAERAQLVLDARRAQKEVELYDKIIEAGRFHASFKVIGTLSSRMSGADGLNPQAINKKKEVREHFKLAHPGMVLSGGDFKGFEVSLAEAVYSSYAVGESKLRTQLLSGKKVHALFGQFVYPEMTYDEIVASDGTANDKYTRAKSGFFALIYGGNEHTLVTGLGVTAEAAETAYAMFVREYPEIGRARQTIMGMFCSMRQPVPRGRVEWHEPAEFIETNLGFRRYFTLENKICKALYELGEKPPVTWNDVKIKVFRSDRVQYATGAVRSALFGAAFGVQGNNMRAAANHVIQGWGAGITKIVQQKIWEVQPRGIHSWRVQPMNIHDEIECPCIPEVVDQVKQIVIDAVEEFRPSVPLIGIGWKTHLTDWASK